MIRVPSEVAMLLQHGTQLLLNLPHLLSFSTLFLICLFLFLSSDSSNGVSSFPCLTHAWAGF